MTTHAILLPGDEDPWGSASPEARARVHVDLLDVCGILAAVGDSLEVRATTSGTGA